MKIVTINVPESYIEAINKLIGANGLYPSRSELIRSAVRDFLIKQLKWLKIQGYAAETNIASEVSENELIKIPVRSEEKIFTYKCLKCGRLTTYDKKTDLYCKLCYETSTIKSKMLLFKTTIEPKTFYKSIKILRRLE